MFESDPLLTAEPPLLKSLGVLFIARADQRTALDAFVAMPDVAPLVRPVSAREARSMVPLLREGYAAAATIELGAAAIDVDGLHQRYLRLLQSNGGQLLTDAPVTGLARRDDVWTVQTPKGDFRAPILVNAAGAWAEQLGALAGARSIGLQARRRTAVLVSPPSGADISAWPMVVDIDETFYLKPDAGLLLLSPADATPSEPCDAQPEELDIAIAVDRIQQAFELDVQRVKRSWAGLRSFVADASPVLGFDPVARGLFWCAAQGGYGVQTAPAMARLGAAMLLGEAVPEALAAHGVDPLALSPYRFS
jgi:D-arginine dehydrogenase